MIDLNTEIFDTTDKLEEYLFEELAKNEDTVLLVDRNMAQRLAYYFEEIDFEDYYGVSTYSDIDKYFIEKNGDSCFCIEPALTSDGEYLSGDTTKLIVMDKYMSEEILKAQGSEKVIVVINLEDLEEDECGTCDSDDCDCENCSVDDDCEEEDIEDDEDLDDGKCSEFDCEDIECIKCCGIDSEDDFDEFDEEDRYYEIDTKVDELYQIIKDNGFSKEVIKFILGEFCKGICK